MKQIIFNSNLLHWFRFISRYGGHRISSSVLKSFEDNGVYMCVCVFVLYPPPISISEYPLLSSASVTGSFATSEDRRRAAF